jgi:FlaA1/EpsC-like NDP-sugar epimerase
MRPRFRNRFVFITDLLLIIVSVLGSYTLRLDFTPDFVTIYLRGALWMMGLALLVKPLVYYLFGLYRRLWIYASINELKLIAVAVTTASVLLSVTVMCCYWLGWLGPGFPRLALAIDWLLSLIFVGGARLTLRIVAEASAPRTGGAKRKALIIGAGDAGALVVKELQKNSQLRLEPVGFLDDDPAKH